MPPKKADKVPRRARRRARVRPNTDLKMAAIAAVLLAVGVAWLGSIRPGGPEPSGLPLTGGGATVGLPAGGGAFPSSRAAIPTPFEANRPVRLDNGLVLETDPIGISLRDGDDRVAPRRPLPPALAAPASPSVERQASRPWWWPPTPTTPTTWTSIVPRNGSSTTSSSSTSSSTSTTPSTTRPPTSTTSTTSTTTSTSSSTTTTTEPTTTTAQPTTTSEPPTTGPPASASSTPAR